MKTVHDGHRDLYWKYQVLLRRGMNRHPRISWLQEHALLNVGQGVNAGFDIDDAVDLVASHALRWYQRHKKLQGDRDARHIRNGAMQGQSKLTLEAILIATENLEPETHRDNPMA